MSTITLVAQVLGISTSLFAAGGIATLSLFDIPELKSQPASRSLPSIRWLFSRGSHIFPSAAVISSAAFAYVAFAALPLRTRTVLQLLRCTSNYWKVNGYLLAAALTLSIGPVTTQLMLPTNFRLIEMNEKKGGARSQMSAQQGSGRSDGTAKDSVDGKGQAAEFRDLSGPQEKTVDATTTEEDQEVNSLLEKFASLNAVRAALMLVGGVVGLVTALAA